jgi:hypothetical protein
MKKIWDDITAVMMTEEEMWSENNHPHQSWCLSASNELMNKLDEDRNSS